MESARREGVADRYHTFKDASQEEVKENLRTKKKGIHVFWKKKKYSIMQYFAKHSIETHFFFFFTFRSHDMAKSE